jgi:phytoene synthase
MMTPQDYVQQKAVASGSSFYYAFLFLPTPPKRAAITAFYAFCREVDDVVDDMVDPFVASTKLAWWQSEVAKSFAGQPSHPVMQALMPQTLRHSASSNATCKPSSRAARWT